MRRLMSLTLLGFIVAAPAAPAGAVTINFAGQTPGDQAASEGGANFQDPGRVQFFQSGPFYFNSNRAWGFQGAFTAEVTFDKPIIDLTVWARGSNGETVPRGGTFGVADVEIKAFAPDDTLLAAIGFGNIGFNDADALNQLFHDFSALGPIGRLELINNGDDDSVALIGQLDFNVVPTPTAPALFAAGTLGMLASRRRRIS